MKFAPHAYQADGVQKIIDQPAVGLMWDMGLGKTVVTLTAVNELKFNRWQVRRCLVIAPKKVAEATWDAEARNWDHLRHLRFSKIMGTAKQRIAALYKPADVYIISRDNVVWLTEYLRSDWCFDMVVVDESSSFKNPSAKRFKALKAVRPKIRRVVELTGTPAPNGLTDLWSQVYLLDQGERLGKFITHYRDRYFYYLADSHRYVAKPEAQGRIQELLSDLCYSLKASDYLTLPECLYQTIPVELDARAAKQYRELERKMLLEVDGSTIDAGSAAVLNNKLLQLGNGACYDEFGAVVPIHDCKIESFLELVEQLNGEHALVFYNFQHDRDRILSALGKSGLRMRVYKDGEDGDAWNAGKVDVLLAHPASCAYGLNLQRGGHHVVWFGLNWALELYQQANARLYRQGQEYPVIIHHLVVQDSVDEDVMRALADKSEVQDALINSLKARIARVRKEAGA